MGTADVVLLGALAAAIAAAVLVAKRGDALRGGGATAESPEPGPPLSGPRTAPTPLVDEQGTPSPELVEAWVHFLLDHVRVAASAMNNRLNSIYHAVADLGDGAAAEQVRTEVRRAANITQELLNRINTRRLDLTPPHWQRVEGVDPQASHILVVDDDDANRAVLARLFRHLGHRVTAAANGVEARDVIFNTQVDCVVCDLHMPTLGGQGFYEQLQESHPPLAARFVFVTGDYSRPGSYDFLQGSGQPVIAKPYELDELLTAVATVLAKNTEQASTPRSSNLHPPRI